MVGQAVLGQHTFQYFHISGDIHGIALEELVPYDPALWAPFRRTRIVDAGTRRLEEIPAFVRGVLEDTSSLLVVCNTKKQSRFLYEQLRQEGVVCLHLSAAMCQAHRKVVIAQMEEALGDEWGKVSETEVVPLTFADDEGDTIICYVCKTAYYTEEIPEVDNLTTVLDEIISPETAEESRSCKVSGLDAMLYKKNGRGFLRWTASPQYSFIIEFTLKNIPEEDIFRMAESIRANTEQ